VTGFGKERQSTSTVDGNPLANGATVRIVAHGDNDQDQTFTLPAGASAPGGVPGWKALGSIGWRYVDPYLANGPVKVAFIKRTNGGTFLVKAMIVGTSPAVGLVPPGNGTEGSMVFTVLGPGGGVYCVTLGGAAGGAVLNSASGTTFKVRNATAEGACLAP
jgi:hypothetical protein